MDSSHVLVKFSGGKAKLLEPCEKRYIDLFQSLRKKIGLQESFKGNSKFWWTAIAYSRQCDRKYVFLSRHLKNVTGWMGLKACLIGLTEWAERMEKSSPSDNQAL